MQLSQAAALPPEERFLYWIRERHDIYLRRQRGDRPPWTDDPVLRGYFFTNPYRENDKTTTWFRDNVRGPLRNDPAVLFTTVCFRWFNLISTGEVLATDRRGYAHNSPLARSFDARAFLKTTPLVAWDKAEVVDRLRAVRELGRPVFTGAYMIKGETGRSKVESVCDRIEAVWRQRARLVDVCRKGRSLRLLVEALTEFPYLGGFMAYEIACDLRYTYLLEDATDRMTWCNPGPGCARGLMRLDGVTPPKNRFGKQKRNGNPLPPDWLDRMARLLDLANRRLKGLPPLEMREVEHSLCEFDKYERARLGDGKMKRRYNNGGKP